MRQRGQALRKIAGILVAGAAAYGIWLCCSPAGSAAGVTESYGGI